MTELRELANRAAEELLKAIREQAATAQDIQLLHLAQAYSTVVSTEVGTRLADESATAAAEIEAGLVGSVSQGPFMQGL